MGPIESKCVEMGLMGLDRFKKVQICSNGSKWVQMGQTVAKSGQNVSKWVQQGKTGATSANQISREINFVEFTFRLGKKIGEIKIYL